MQNFKDIHIGKYIRQKYLEEGIDSHRAAAFLNCSEEEIPLMFEMESMDTQLLLRWTKLLKYDFFRIYTQHVILFSPQNFVGVKEKAHSTSLPQFRKSIYTKEIIDFCIRLVTTGEKTKKQIIDEYGIPKTTLYKWLMKYQNDI